MTKTLLTAKERKLTPAGQVAALIRKARRAQSKADWFGDILAGDVMDMDLVDVPKTTKDRDALLARASQACDEVIEIVNANPTAGWTREQRAYCARQAS